LSVPLTSGLRAAILIGLIACQPDTTRPAIVPLPEAAMTEIRLPVPEATRVLAQALQADSIPALRVRLRDGYIESGWFDAGTGRPTNRRPIGVGIVRIRAWADPARPGDSQLRVETLYRPLADPSLPERELERQVPVDHPIAVKVRSSLQDMLKRYGGPPTQEVQQQPAGPTEEEAPDE
jgi:hypothetical protein